MGDPTGPKGPSGGKPQSTAQWVVSGLAAAFDFVARAADPGAAQFVDEMNEELRRREAQRAREEEERRREAERVEREREQRRRGERALALEVKRRGLASLALHRCADENERSRFDLGKKEALQRFGQAEGDPTLDAYKAAIQSLTGLQALVDAADEAVRKRLEALGPLGDALARKQPDAAASAAEAESVKTKRTQAESAIAEARRSPTTQALQDADEAVQATQGAVDTVKAAVARRREAIEALQLRAAKAKLDDGALPAEQKALKDGLGPATEAIDGGLAKPTVTALEDAGRRVEDLEAQADALNQQIADRRSRIAALQHEIDQLARPKGLLSIAQAMQASALRKRIEETRKVAQAASAGRPERIEEAEAAVERLARDFADLVAHVDSELGLQAATLRRHVADLERGNGPQGEEVQAVEDANRLIGVLDGHRADVAALDFTVVHEQLQKRYLPLLKTLERLVRARSAEPPMTPEQFTAWSRARALGYFRTNVPLRVRDAPWLGRQGPVLEVTIDARDTVLWQQIRTEFHGKAITVPEGKTYNGQPVRSPVTYYVTQSSNSGFAFDITGHLWRRGAEVMSAIFVLHVSNRAEAYVDAEILAGRL